MSRVISTVIILKPQIQGQEPPNRHALSTAMSLVSLNVHKDSEAHRYCSSKSNPWCLIPPSKAASRQAPQGGTSIRYPKTPSLNKELDVWDIFPEAPARLAHSFRVSFRSVRSAGFNWQVSDLHFWLPHGSLWAFQGFTVS